MSKTDRMRALYEREKRLRESALRVVSIYEPRPPKPAVFDQKTKKWSYYVESRTAAALRRVFEEGEEPWWHRGREDDRTVWLDSRQL